MSDQKTKPKPFDLDLYNKEMQEAMDRGEDEHAIVTTPEVDFSMDNIKRANPADEEAYFQKHFGSGDSRTDTEKQTLSKSYGKAMDEDNARKERSRKHREALKQPNPRTLDVGDDTDED